MKSALLSGVAFWCLLLLAPHIYAQSPTLILNTNVSPTCIEEFTVKLYDPGTENLLNSYTGTLESSSQITLNNLPEGKYDVFLKFDRYLQRGEPAVDLIPGENTLDFLDLQVGDINNSKDGSLVNKQR